MSNGQFQPGKDPRRNTKGSPKSGRSKALALVDAICKEPKNLKSLKDALQTEFDSSPLAFFHSIIVPLRPKDTSSGEEAVGYALLTPSDACAAMDTATVSREADIE